MASELDPLSPLLLNGEVPDGWFRRRLGEVAAISGGTTPSRADDRYWGGSAQWATPTDLTSRPAGLLEISTTAEALTPAAVEETSVRVLPVHSVLMTSRATIGEVAINAVPMATNQGFCNFIPKQHTDPIFLAHWLAGNKKRLERLAGGSTFLELAKRDAREVRIHLPPLPEQRKIAAILSSVGDAIAAAGKVIDQTKRVKQGLLQALITRGIGNTQFKKTHLGEIPAAWEVVRLGAVATLQRGFDITVAEQNPGAVPVVSSSGINSWHDQAKVQPPGVVTGRKGALGSVYYLDVPFWPHDTSLWVKDFHGNDPRWVAWLLRSLRLERYDAATSVPTLNRNNVHPLRVRRPPVGEQAAIADRLDHFERVGVEQEKLIVSLGRLKRGLMQDLLTGRVRVQPD